MKLVICFIVLVLSFIITSFAEAKGIQTRYYQVPFYDAPIYNDGDIFISYKFDPATQVVVCTQAKNSKLLSSVEWKYKFYEFKGQLPLTLKANAEFEGQWADTDGHLSIRNDSGSYEPTMFVSCEYKTMS